MVKVWQEAASQPAKPLAEQSTVKFPYLTLPAMPTGTSAAAWQPILSGKAFQTRVAAKDLNLQIEEATLPNGIRLYLQPLTMEKGTVQASLIFGSGTQTYEDIDAWKPKLAQSRSSAAWRREAHSDADRGYPRNEGDRGRGKLFARPLLDQRHRPEGRREDAA